MTPQGRPPRSALAPASVVEAVSSRAARLDEAVDPTRAADEMLAALGEAYAAGRGSLMLLNPRTGWLRIVAAWGLRPDVLGQDLPPTSRRISDRVLRESHGVILNGEVRDERFVPSAPHDLIVSAICVPLPGARGPAGVLNLARMGGAALFSAEDLAALETVAPAIAAVLERTMELGDARRFMRRLQGRCGAAPSLLLRAGELVHAHVSGRSAAPDVCDWVVHPDGTVNVMLAEPFGDGATAWRLGEWLLGLFRGAVANVREPGSLASAMHARVRERASGGSARAWLGAMSPNGQLRSCAAGYPPPLAVPAEGEPGSRLLEGGPPLGAAPGHVEYESTAMRLLPGDALLVVSDGVLNAISSTGEPFGERGVLDALHDLRHRPLATLVEGVTEAARRHAELAAPVDDLVAVAMRFTRDR